jgi:hypothetical protein
MLHVIWVAMHSQQCRNIAVCLCVGKGNLSYHLNNKRSAGAHLHIPHIEAELQMREHGCQDFGSVHCMLVYLSQSSGGGRVWHVIHAHPKEGFEERRLAVALHWQRDVICRKNRSACS